MSVCFPLFIYFILVDGKAIAKPMKKRPIVNPSTNRDSLM
jgi:hypothetical protein